MQPNSSSPQQAPVPPVSRGLQTVCDSEPRTSDVATHTGPQRTQRNSTYAAATANPPQPTTHNRQKTPQVAIIGTSLVRGLGTRLIKRGIHANTFMFPGAEIPVLRDRIPGILNSKYQPDIVVLQCGGNDAENGRPPAQVIRQFDYLIREIKRCCPSAKIIINKIPPRGLEDELLAVISKLNTYVMNMSKDKRRQVTCSDACPKAYRYYQKDEIHFNHAGKQYYASEMSKTLLNFLKHQARKKR